MLCVRGQLCERLAYAAKGAIRRPQRKARRRQPNRAVGGEAPRLQRAGRDIPKQSWVSGAYAFNIEGVGESAVQHR